MGDPTPLCIWDISASMEDIVSVGDMLFLIRQLFSVSYLSFMFCSHFSFIYPSPYSLINEGHDGNDMVKDLPDHPSDFILYTDPDGDVKVEVIVKEDTVWLNQKGISDLFGVNVPGINKHLKNIFDSGELDRSSTISILEIVQIEGGRKVSRNVEFYNLDAIIAVGYRVNSYKATRFRIWATKVLKEYLIKGFVLDDERLKQGSTLIGKDYFDELLERIREIRALPFGHAFFEIAVSSIALTMIPIK
jgi:hypothetical protein